MAISYDREVNAAYLSLVEDGTVSTSVEVAPGVIVDLDTNKNVLGLELLYPARELPKSALKEHMDEATYKEFLDQWLTLRRVLNKATNVRRGR